MRTLAVILIFAVIAVGDSQVALSDSRGDELAQWLDERGREVWGEPPNACDDLTFARRLYLDLLGRVPSVSELRDFQELDDNRRTMLVEHLVFGEGPRAETYRRLSSGNLARHWRRVLLPPGTTANGSPATIEQWLSEGFAKRTPYDELMRELARIQTPQSAGQYYQLLGALPENYAGHVSRVMLGVRIECAQCHDHPFTDWKQEDFWGLAAFYADMARVGDDPNASSATKTPGSIEYEGTVYPAKLLWSQEPLESKKLALRTQLAGWLTGKDNPHFAATAVNRFWQHLVGHGLYADVENLDLATPKERAFLDELGQRFADDAFDINRLMAAICKTSWYQAESVEKEVAADSLVTGGFARNLKVISPEQVFDSLEQSLLLPVSRIDPTSSRWSGDRLQLVSRLSETVGATPEDYASGIPQALLLMNGRMTSDAISPDRSRLLRAVVESPFFNDSDRIKTLYLAVLTREPSGEESKALADYLDSKPQGGDRQRAYGEILWALLNSPEFVLCR